MKKNEKPIYTIELNFYKDGMVSCVHGTEQDIDPRILGVFNYFEEILMKKASDLGEWLNDKENPLFSDDDNNPRKGKSGDHD